MPTTKSAMRTKRASSAHRLHGGRRFSGLRHDECGSFVGGRDRCDQDVGTIRRRVREALDRDSVRSQALQNLPGVHPGGSHCICALWLDCVQIEFLQEDEVAFFLRTSFSFLLQTNVQRGFFFLLQTKRCSMFFIKTNKEIL